MLAIPYVISFALGFLVLSCLNEKEQPFDFLERLFLGMGLGLGISGWLNFLHLVFFNQINFVALVSLHVILLITFSIIRWIQAKAENITEKTEKQISRNDLISISLLGVCLIPIYISARVYLYGGWDAWVVWNFKARFLLRAGPYWTNLFGPHLLDSRPHYPLLLPLINVWAWIFQREPLFRGPMWTSVAYSFLTCSLLWICIRRSCRRLISVLPALFLATLPVFLTWATIQYADILIAYFLLASLFCVRHFFVTEQQKSLILSSFFLGLLSFTKSEGTIAAFIIVSFLAVQLLRKERIDNILIFAGTFLLASLPTIIFYLLYSPGDQLFVNGLLSETRPISLYRLKVILSFVGFELTNDNWMGIWILCAVGFLISAKRSLKNYLLLIPGFLVFYGLSIFLFYFINTHWNILWWLATSLKRIMVAALPLVLWWISSSFLAKKI